MNDNRLKNYLGKVSMHLFAEYFELFINERISNQEISAKILDQYRYSEKSCHSRTGHARMIIREGGAENALKIIVRSSNVAETAKLIAKKHLEKFYIKNGNLDLL